jgi:hypothetical protein
MENAPFTLELMYQDTYNTNIFIASTSKRKK